MDMIIIIYLAHVLYDAIIMTGLLHFGKIEIINVDHKPPFIVNNMSLGIKRVFNFFVVNYRIFACYQKRDANNFLLDKNIRDHIISTSVHT